MKTNNVFLTILNDPTSRSQVRTIKNRPALRSDLADSLTDL
jgi:hypothetical protein